MPSLAFNPIDKLYGACMNKVMSLVLAGLLSAVAMSEAQSNPVISYFDYGSGELVFGEVDNATNYYVLRSSDIMTDWSRISSALDVIAPSGTGSVTCSVPVQAETVAFFRVCAEVEQFTAPAITMVAIVSNQFLMGSAFPVDDYYLDESPTHSVTLDAYSIGAYEITWDQWTAVRDWAVSHGYSLAEGSGVAGDHPVNSVSWYDTVKWCNALSEMAGLTPCYTVTGSVYRAGATVPDCNWQADGYRLPSDAEWEWSARGEYGGRRFPWIDPMINHTHANYVANNQYSYDDSPYDDFTYHPTFVTEIEPFTSPVGSFLANGSGLYDSAGNVAEWCWDWYDAYYYSENPVDNPHGPDTGTDRSIRGGGWHSDAFYCRVSARMLAGPDEAYIDVGFRICRTAP